MSKDTNSKMKEDIRKKLDPAEAKLAIAILSAIEEDKNVSNQEIKRIAAKIFEEEVAKK